MHSLAAVIMRVFFRIQVTGAQNLPEKGGFILVSNHASYLDPMALGAGCSRKLNFMAKEELFRSRASRWFFTALGAFPVKRNSADLSALKEAMRRVKQDQVLVLFPEGTRQADGSPSAPYPGVGFLAAKLNVPVIPAAITGTGAAFPKGARRVRFVKVYLRFGRQISIERRMPYQDIARQIMENIRHLAC